MPHTRRVSCFSRLEGHKLAIGGHHRIGGLAAFKIIEVGQPDQVFTGAVQLQFPDVQVTRSARAAEPVTLAIHFHGGVLAIRENAFRFIKSLGPLGKISNSFRYQIHPLYLERPVGHVAKKRQLGILGIKVLGFHGTGVIPAFHHRLFIHQPGDAAGEVEVGNH